MRIQAKGVAINSALFAGEVPASRWIDDNGFLHITLRFMRTGLLKYAPIPETFPDGVPPNCIGTDGNVTVLVEPDDLAEPDSLSSLAGLDILRKHEWATPNGTRDAVGSVAGVPQFDGEFVTGEAVIKDADTIRRLQLPDGDTEKLSVTSASYGHLIQWDGEPYIGKAYAGRQRKLRYNHAVLLPKGEGRCGDTVCVMNAKEGDKGERKMSDTKGVSWYSRLYGRVFNATDEREAEEMAKLDEKIVAENEGEGGDSEHEKSEIRNAEELLAKLSESNKALEAMKAENEELKAQLSEIKAKIEKEIGADEIEAKAEEISGEREEIAEVMNARGVMDKASAMNSLKQSKLHGQAAKVYAMNCIREKQGREKMSDEQAASAIAVNAAWDVLKDSVPVTRRPVGAPVTPGMAQNVANNGFGMAQNAREAALDKMFGVNRKKK